MPNRARKRPQTERDIAAIWTFIAADSVSAADAVLDGLEQAFGMLAQAPRAGRARDDLGPRLRSFPVGSYVIFYLAISDGIEVVRVLHGRQDVAADNIQ